MKRVNQGTALVFLVGSLLVMLEAKNLEYYSSIGPGPGFFPMWLGGALALLSIAWLVQSTQLPSDPMEKGFIPDLRGVLRMFSIVAALTLMGLLMEVVGFQLSAFAFLLFLLLALGRQNLPLTLVISVAGSFGLYYLFNNYLDVALPTASIEFLTNLGL